MAQSTNKELTHKILLSILTTTVMRKLISVHESLCFGFINCSR